MTATTTIVMRLGTWRREITVHLTAGVITMAKMMTAANNIIMLRNELI